jgi:ABC-type transport system substrate-binding protein
MPEVVESWEKLNKAVGNEAIARAAKDYENVLFKKMFRVPLWQANVPYAVNQRVESYDPRCRA